MIHLFGFIKNDSLRLFAVSLALFFIFILSVCSMALFNIISVESNPFFYMNF
ncbi:MAG: hypothetical protein LWX07_09745 [Bacteroidetes bacterium]|nr:hypothetical protein [Bacteroidota bacterium]